VNFIEALVMCTVEEFLKDKLKTRQFEMIRDEKYWEHGINM